MYFLLNLRHCVKGYGYLCQILACFTKYPTNMVMSGNSSCNFENFYLLPNFASTFRKVHKISSGKVLYFRSYQPKISMGEEGGKHPLQGLQGKSEYLSCLAFCYPQQEKIKHCFNPIQAGALLC